MLARMIHQTEVILWGASAHLYIHPMLNHVIIQIWIVGERHSLCTLPPWRSVFCRHGDCLAVIGEFDLQQTYTALFITLIEMHINRNVHQAVLKSRLKWRKRFGPLHPPGPGLQLLANQIMTKQSCNDVSFSTALGLI